MSNGCNVRNFGVAVGTIQDVSGSPSYSSALSLDGGKSWEGVVNSDSIFTEGNGIAGNGVFWVGVGKGSFPIAYSNQNPYFFEWIGVSNSSDFFTTGNGVAWNGDMWVAVGEPQQDISGADVSGTPIAISQDGRKWSGVDNSISKLKVGYGVAWTGSNWVAVGEGNTETGINGIIYSDASAQIWTVVETNLLTSIRGIAYDSNSELLVAVGVGNTTTSIIYSDISINIWTGIENGIFYTGTFGSTGNAIAWNGSQWAAVGNSDNNTIATSDNGKDWNSIANSNKIFKPNPGSSGGGQGIGWTGESWVATGLPISDVSASSIAYSDPSGIEWTGVSNSSSIFKEGNGVFFQDFVSPAPGLIGVSSTNSSGIFITDNNAESFNYIEGSNEILETVYDVKWNGKIWVAVGSPATTGVNVSSTIAYSTCPYGNSWTGVPNSISLLNTGVAVEWNGTQWVAVAQTSADINIPNYYYSGFFIAYSQDGINWTKGEQNIGGNVITYNPPPSKPLSWNGNQWILLLNLLPAGDNSRFNYTNMYVSQDVSGDINFNLVTPSHIPAPNNYNTVLDSPVQTQELQMTIGVGPGSSGGIITDGTITVLYGSFKGENIIVGDFFNYFIQPGPYWSWYTTETIITATTNWYSVENPIFGSTKTAACYDMAWNGVAWVAVGGGGTDFSIAFSPDGIHWTGVGNSSSLSANFYSITWNGTVWIATGGKGDSVFYSTDINGQLWLEEASFNNPINPGNALSFNFVNQIVNKLPPINKSETSLNFGVACGPVKGFEIVTTNDGTTWSSIDNPPFNVEYQQCANAVWNGQMWVAVGGYPDWDIDKTISQQELENCQTIYYSTDSNATTWKAANFSGNTFYFIANGKDGLSIIPYYPTQRFGSNYASSVVWNGNYWLAAGAGTLDIPVLVGFDDNIEEDAESNVNIVYVYSSPKFAKSQDGINWSVTTSSNLTGDVTNMIWENGLWLITGPLFDASNNPIGCAYSTDGETWRGITYNSSPTLYLGRAYNPIPLNPVIGWDGSKFVLLTPTFGNTSPDTYIPGNCIASQTFYGDNYNFCKNFYLRVVGGGGRTVPYQPTGTNTYITDVYTSTNGINFDYKTAIQQCSMTSIAWNGALWVGTSIPNTNNSYPSNTMAIFNSNDGINWTGLEDSVDYFGTPGKGQSKTQVIDNNDFVGISQYTQTCAIGPLTSALPTGVSWDGKVWVITSNNDGKVGLFNTNTMGKIYPKDPSFNTLHYSPDGIHWLGVESDRNVRKNAYGSVAFKFQNEVTLAPMQKNKPVVHATATNPIPSDQLPPEVGLGGCSSFFSADTGENLGTLSYFYALPTINIKGSVGIPGIQLPSFPGVPAFPGTPPITICPFYIPGTPGWYFFPGTPCINYGPCFTIPAVPSFPIIPSFPLPSLPGINLSGTGQINISVASYLKVTAATPLVGTDTNPEDPNETPVPVIDVFIESVRVTFNIDIPGIFNLPITVDLVNNPITLVQDGDNFGGQIDLESISIPFSFNIPLDGIPGVPGGNLLSVKAKFDLENTLLLCASEDEEDSGPIKVYTAVDLDLNVSAFNFEIGEFSLSADLAIPLQAVDGE